MTKQEELNQIFKDTADNYTGLLQGLSQDDLLELAKSNATEALEGIKDTLRRLSATLKGVIL